MGNRLLIEETLSAETVREGLKTDCFGQEIRCLSSTESTNMVARKLAQKGAQEGTLIITDYQTRGKGRLERKWWSPPGENLLFSIIFRPPFEVSHSFRLTVISSLAVAHAITQETGLKALIKWPNDIYIKEKKVSGILSELGVYDGQLQHAVVGIGININSNPSTYPEIRDTATSVCRELGQTFPRLRLLKAILEMIERYYYRLKKGDFSSLKQTWDALSLIKGKKVKVVSSGLVQEGIAESIDEDGFLMLRKYSGAMKRIVSADVSLSVI